MFEIFVPGMRLNDRATTITAKGDYYYGKEAI
jgi:hypothetical protein